MAEIIRNYSAKEINLFRVGLITDLPYPSNNCERRFAATDISIQGMKPPHEVFVLLQPTYSEENSKAFVVVLASLIL